MTLRNIIIGFLLLFLISVGLATYLSPRLVDTHEHQWSEWSNIMERGCKKCNQKLYRVRCCGFCDVCEKELK